MPTTQEGGTSLSRLVDCYKAVSEGAVVKVLISNGDKNTDERQIVSEVVKAASPMLTSEALPVIGVPPVPIGAMRSGGVSGSSTLTFRRHPAANYEDRALSCRFLASIS